MFIFALIILILAATSFMVSKFASAQAKDPDYPSPKKVVKVVGSVFLGLGLLFMLISSIAIVSTKNVGIETAFGRTSGHLSNGFHLIPPWDSVTEMDAAIQTDSYTRGNCLDVRIANQQTACVDISIRWRIESSAADYLFQNYRTFENVRDSLVTRELRAAINAQLADYNPLNSIQTTFTPGGPTNPSLNQVAGRVTDQMRREIGANIVVLNTIIPFISFDPATQARLNQLQQQEALTRVAQAQEQTNLAQSAANNALAQSVNNSINVLISKCLDIQQEIVKNGGIPYSSCFSGTGSGGSTNVVVTPGK
jgi:regulator of protease activity HflC (stomatin/prohibitin superfamily)